MNKTIEYYNQHAQEFYNGTVDADMSYCRERFLAHLPERGKILDAGCGSGRDSKSFLEAGYDVDAFDASEELCRLASEWVGRPVQCMRFEELVIENIYDGIWASASLLHVTKADLPEVLQKLHRALKPDGVLYASFKYGATERIKDDRFFNDYTETMLIDLMEAVGFVCKECFVTADVREGRSREKWVNVIAQRVRERP